MNLRNPLLILGAALALAGCAEKPWTRPVSIPTDVFADSFQAWQEYRRSRLVAPGPGPVTWVGLWELPAGASPIGADPTLPVVLANAAVPPLAGTLERTGQTVRFVPAAGGAVHLANGQSVDGPMTLASDRTDSATVLAIGSLRLRLHGEAGTDRLWMRAWDEEHPDRATFRLPAFFELDSVWRISARLQRFKAPRIYRVADILGGPQEFRSPGRLVFRVAGKEYRLAAFADSTSRNFFVMFWDSTARSETYQAGRYLQVPLADSTGWTVIDFNRAYNPPCVFTTFSTCALPPRENRLPLPVTAGEKRKTTPL